MTSKEKLLTSKPVLEKRTVAGADVWFKPLTRAMFRKCMEDDNGDEMAVTASTCNEDGSPMFTGDEVGDMDMPVFRELVQACLEASGCKPSGN